MSFLFFFSEKGKYNEDELKNELERRGATNPDDVMDSIVKMGKMVFGGLRIMLLN
ncbi:hypothetical protein D3C78_1265360 [compost metagenome]